jgi:hypothetical protein
MDTELKALLKRHGELISKSFSTWGIDKDEKAELKRVGERIDEMTNDDFSRPLGLLVTEKVSITNKIASIIKQMDDIVNETRSTN